MTSSVSTTPPPQPGQLLRSFHPFDRLPLEAAAALELKLEPRRYRLGQIILRADVMPEGVLLLRSGSLRCLAPDPDSGEWRTIDRLEAGAIAGWCSILRSEPFEQIRASSEVELLLLPAAVFQDLLASHHELRLWFQGNLPATELHLLLSSLAQQDQAWLPVLQAWPAIRQQARVESLPPGTAQTLSLNADCRWFTSSGGPLGQPWSLASQAPPARPGAAWLRLVGLPLPQQEQPPVQPPVATPATTPADNLLNIGAAATRPAPAPSTPSAESYAISPPEPSPRAEGRGAELRLRRASGPGDVPLAIAMALGNYFGVPVNRDSLRDQVESILQRQGHLNLINLGQILDTLGLRVVLTKLPADRLQRTATPAVFFAQGHFAILEGVEPDGRLRLLEPELGPVLLPPSQLSGDGDGLIELLLLQRKPDAKEQRFSWSWFTPFIQDHKRQLIEVLVLSFVINLLQVANPLGLQALIDQVARQQNLNALISITSVLLVVALVNAVLKTLRSYIFTDTANRVDQATKATILDQLVRLPQGFFDSRPVGQIMFYFGELDRLRDFLLGSSLTTMVDLAFSFFYLFILFAISPPLTLAALSTLPLMLALAFVSNPLVRTQIKRKISESINTYSYLNESIAGIQTIKSQNAELKTRWEFQNRYARFIGEDFKLKITSESISNLAGFINDLNSLLITGVGIFLIMRNELTFGGFLAFRILSSFITGPLVKLTQTWQEFQQGTASIKLVADVVDRTTEQTVEESQNIPMPPVIGKVEFIDLTFRFSEEGPLILRGVNLEVPVGSFVGMVGGSGSGKSTVLKMLPRFYRPLEGKVLIDGLDINKVELYSLRRQIGVVPQDSILFDGTIRQNLLLVKPDASADELIRACRIACAHEFIMGLPKGYNSDVGERGAGLSGGQRQRIALARAVLQNPRLLILDEATSALDARTERQVCINLFEAFRGRTVFFITHRLTTVQTADVIVLMDRGAIMEAGTHRELLQRKGWYYALYESQVQEGGM
ncbi:MULTISPECIES: ABC transporter transmembrane domain-containing protein [unclassified Synechococcus]|uniref:ABC transporter transmembrane domain-containing protein n=1 Tax=unclassified Synechococcus TaxID=2626047 RepID=UPI0000698F62|nr:MULTISPECIES: peptidase domain-containing ABC transporter [unclassified Synechococcus]EAQ74125.1 putative multidrug efflux ABC transporter [Synechococcus sp. WH 5701]WFN58390.1 peptidase domain-containing ABC transporter [Synechococcus sp. CCFWC 502]